MQNPPQKHHYIPVFYSSSWAGIDGKLLRFDQPHLKLVDRRVFPSQVGFQTNLYSIPGISGERAQQIEISFFKRVDDAAARAARLLLSGSKSLDVSARVSWTRFILSLMHRTPSSFAAFREGLKILVSKPDPDTQTRYERIKGNGDPPTVEEFLKVKSPYAIEHAAYSIIPRLMDHQRLGTHIINMKWGTLNLEKARHSLLLSDAPLITSNGIGNADGHILLPLGPRRLFYAVVSEAVRNQLLSLPANELVRRVNRLIVRRARHFVVASDLTQHQFIAKHFGCEPFETWAEQLHRQYLD